MDDTAAREPDSHLAADDQANLLDGDAHDRRLVRATLAMGPAQRLHNLANTWPLARAQDTLTRRRRERGEESVEE